MPITIKNADQMDTKEGCLVVLDFKCENKKYKKTFRCVSDIRIAIRAAAKYEKEVRDKNAKPSVDRIGDPLFEMIDGECYAVCKYRSRRGRMERRAMMKVGSQDPDEVLRKVFELASQMVSAYRSSGK